MFEKSTVPSTDVILIGAGIQHLETIRRYAQFKDKPFRLTLISENGFAYSRFGGLQIISGECDLETNQIDIGHLCNYSGVVFVKALVVKIDRKNKLIHMSSGIKKKYDLISINVGCQSIPCNLPKSIADISITSRPFNSFFAHLESIKQKIKLKSDSKPFSLIIAGYHLFTYELCVALHSYFYSELENKELKISFGLNQEIEQKNLTSKVQTQLQKILANLSIEICKVATPIDYEPNSKSLIFQDRSKLNCDLIIWTHQLGVPSWLRESEIELDRDGYIQTMENFESLFDPSFYACGDIVTLDHPFAASHAIDYDKKSAKVLAENLPRIFKGSHQLRCQYHGLFSRIYLEPKKVHFIWGDHVYSGFLAKLIKSFRNGLLKHSIYQIQPTQPRLPTYIESGKITFNLSGGESTRYPLEVLNSISNQGKHPFVHIENNHIQAMVNCREFNSDLFVFTTLTCNHILNYLYSNQISDIHLNLGITTKYSPRNAIQADFDTILSALKQSAIANEFKIDTLNALNAAENSLSILARGRFKDTSVLYKTIDQPCDIIITKPLGTGVITAGFYNHMVSSQSFYNSLEVMQESHKEFYKCLQDRAPLSIWPVGPYGVIKDLYRLIDHRHKISINLNKVPLFDGSINAVKAGVRTSLHVQNRILFTRSLERIPQQWLPIAELTFDPQTSGALVIISKKEDSFDITKNLHRAGFSFAEVIGEILPCSKTEQRVQFLFS